MTTLTGRAGRTARTGRTGRTWAFDGLRGLAAIGVVMYHYLYHGPQLYPQLGPMHQFASYGRYGVDVFFVISGAVIFVAATRSGARTFLLKRAIRLYPAYIFAVLLTFAVVSAAGLPGREVGRRTALVNLTMFQEFFRVPHVDGAYWTLTVELAFYLQIAVIAFAIRRFAWPAVPVIVGWLVAITALSLLLGTQTVLHSALATHLLSWMPMFGFGIGIGIFLAGDKLGGLIVGAVALGGVALINEAHRLAFVVCAALVIATLFIPFRERAAKANTFLGDMSYPLYLLHQNLGYVVLLFLAGLGWSQGISVVVTAIAAVVGAGLVHRWYEAPVRAWLAARSKNRMAAWDRERVPPPA